MNAARAIAFQVGLVILAIARRLIERVSRRKIRTKFAMVMEIAFAENVNVTKKKTFVILANFAKIARFVFYYNPISIIYK